MRENVLQTLRALGFFHKLFTPAYVVSAHPLESSTLARLPSGLFFACHKTFSINAVQPSPMTRLFRVCVWTLPPLKHSISPLSVTPFFEVFVMRLTLPALVLGLLVAQGAMAAGDGTAAIGGGLGGALGNVVGQSMGGSTGAAIGAGVAGAAGSAPRRRGLLDVVRAEPDASSRARGADRRGDVDHQPL